MGLNVPEIPLELQFRPGQTYDRLGDEEIIGPPEDADDTAEEEDVDEDGDEGGDGQEEDAGAHLHPTELRVVILPVEC